MKTITVKEGQTLEDIAIQYYGCFEGVITLMQDNDLALDSPLYVGRALEIQDEVPALTPTNKKVVEAFERKGYSPNSGVNNDSNPAFPFMEVGVIEVYG